MNKTLETTLIQLAKSRQVTEPSHDFQHILRVLALAKKIGEHEGADLDIVIPSALFHDTVVYRKDSPMRQNETEESAAVTGDILNTLETYPKDKIAHVQTCIRECSFTKGLQPTSRESAVLQDADLLESTGAISIARTFSSCGQMNRQFYFAPDPFRKSTEPDVRSSGLDLFYVRLLKAEGRIHSDFAKSIAKRRTRFLKDFIDELELELVEADIILA
jgi:uncharacterized protein